MASSVDFPAHDNNNNNNNKVNSDDDLDPAAFLKSVRELSEKREREDVERYRKLEQEVEKSRAARAARRAEHARSISPEKTPLPATPSADTPRRIPANANISTASLALASPAPSQSPAMDQSISQSSPSVQEDIPEFKGFGSMKKSSAQSSPRSSQASEIQEDTPSHAQTATSLARSGTLSWQRRPNSMISSRPVSGIGSSDSPRTTMPSAGQPDQSRDQIAAALGSRDPAWFRQTADRGAGSAAYRKSKDEVAPSGGRVLASGRRGLPGMSSGPSTQSERPSSLARSEDFISETSRPSSTRDSTYSTTRFSGSTPGSTPSKPDLKSLIAADEPQLQASPLSDRDLSENSHQSGPSRALTMSTSQSRLASTTERPSSPTKGMGGFVQSAMMKRSDSVNKRGSVQPGVPGLSRQNSMANTRNVFGVIQGSHSMPRLERAADSTEHDKDPVSRPGSRSSNNLPSLTQTAERDEDGFVKPSLPHHNRSKSVVSNYRTSVDESTGTPPASPGKRWRSPTKSSWIESALMQPDSPKLAPARNSQPSWMADITRAKAQKANTETNLPNSTPNVPENGMRSRTKSPSKESLAAFGSTLKRPEARDLPPAPAPSSTPPMPSSVDASPIESPLAPNLRTSPPRPDIDAASHFYGADNGTSRGVIDSREDASRLVEADDDAMSEKPILRTMKSASESPVPKSTPDTSSRPATDFRSALKSRATVTKKQDDVPEFLSKFNQLRKAQAEKYIAPDVLKANITRGKSELAKTDGPIKSVRKDELKESLLAKKDDIKKAKDEGRDLPGQVHHRKTSIPPVTPSKPEALAKKELLARPDSSRKLGTTERSNREATPEALAKQKSLKSQHKAAATPDTEQPKFAHLAKQVSAPAVVETTASEANSRLAARFNPGLAGILARGPLSTDTSNAPSRSGSPLIGQSTTSASPGEPATDGAPLHDMRKGRAKGPKKSKAGAVSEDSSAKPASMPAPVPQLDVEHPAPIQFVKPRAPPPGSAESLMIQSPGGRTTPKPEEEKSEQTVSAGTKREVAQPSLTLSSNPRPAHSSATSVVKMSQDTAPPLVKLSLSQAKEQAMTSAKSPNISSYSQPAVASLGRSSKNFSRPRASLAVGQSNNPENGGLGFSQKFAPARKVDEDKENGDSPLPSVKAVASFWSKAPSSPHKVEKPSQIQLPSQKDEEAAMRSAGLLAKTSSMSPSTRGLGIGLDKSNASSQPPKPVKSSRVVSGQLQEASANKGPVRQPETEAHRLLRIVFGSIPSADEALAVDTRAAFLDASTDTPAEFRTVKRTVQEVLPDSTLQTLQPQVEYTLFDEHVYVCAHTYVSGGSAKRNQIFVWSGSSAVQQGTEQAQVGAKRIAREMGSAPIYAVRQGQESEAFLQAMGGILVTRRGTRDAATKQYLLCGRKHLDQITFDEADFSSDSLVPGFACLVSYPVTLQQTRLYLWKGTASSPEEVSGARLAAMDLSESGDIIEVDGGGEFASFLKAFGSGTQKNWLPQMTDIWRHKAASPMSFTVRLYKIQRAETRSGFLSLFGRRPSWNQSASPSPTGDVKVEAKHIKPFIQADLEADAVYVLDAYYKVILLVGPLFSSRPEHIRDALFTQAVLFAADYKATILSTEQRAVLQTKADDYVLFSGVPSELKSLFRHWDEARGLWGTAGLMAGSQNSTRVRRLPLENVLSAVTRP